MSNDEPIMIEYDDDPFHTDVCDKPLAACPQCAQAFGLVWHTPK